MKSSSIITRAGADLPSGYESGAGRLPRVALICDFLEENWPSMDLFGDMLVQRFRAEHAEAIEVEQLRPVLRRLFSKLPGLETAGFSRNADRLLNRFYYYPAWLKKHVETFDLFHLVDHSYSQLILDLPRERAVVTCHDLDTFKCLLEPDSEPRPRWFRAMAQRTLDGFMRAAHVICVSAFTRANLLRHGLFSPERVTVITPGADPIFFSSVNSGRPENGTGGHRDQTYLLHVGSTIRRKRIDVLLRVFARVVAENEAVQLMRVGGAFTAEQQRLAEELKICGQDRTLSASLQIAASGRVPQRRLRAANFRRRGLRLAGHRVDGLWLSGSGK